MVIEKFTKLLTLRIIIFVDVAPMVQDAKAVAMNITDAPSISRWRESNRAVSEFPVSVKISYRTIPQYRRRIYLF